MKNFSGIYKHLFISQSKHASSSIAPRISMAQAPLVNPDVHEVLLRRHGIDVPDDGVHLLILDIEDRDFVIFFVMSGSVISLTVFWYRM
jgi:hypothetical protein